MNNYFWKVLGVGSVGFQRTDYLVILAYMAGVLGMGIFLARRQHDSEDYFLGGRKLPWFAVGLSLVASLISTLSYLGYPGEVIRHGVANAVSNLVIPLALLLISLMWLPFFMRLRLISVYEYLGRRFGLGAHWVGVGLFVFILRMGWMAVIVLTVSQAVAHITFDSAQVLLERSFGWKPDYDSWIMVLMFASGILATVYTMLGGIKAVIWTDVAQFFVLLVGALLTLIIVAHETQTGPDVWWHTLTAVNHKPLVVASWDLSERTTLLWISLYIFFWFMCTYSGDQVAMQRYFSTPSIRAGVYANIVNCVAQLVLTAILALCGMALLTYYTQFPAEIVAGITDPQNPLAADSVFPHFIGHNLPAGISGLVVAALFAVAMSSLDSGLNSVSTVLTVDVFGKLKPNRTSYEQLVLARILTMVLGVVVTALSIAMMRLPDDWNIIDTCLRTFDCALGPLAAMFIVGMFLPHVGQRAIIISALTGLAVAFVIAWWTELGWLLGLIKANNLDTAIQTIRRPSSYLALPASTVFTFLMAAVLGAFLRGPDLEKTHALSWRAVVFGSHQPKT